jgi:hypothetical protein
VAVTGEWGLRKQALFFLANFRGVVSTAAWRAVPCLRQSIQRVFSPSSSRARSFE